MTLARTVKIIFWVSLAGLLFSGYLSGVKLWSGSCAFNETCPYFLGYPSCWYGFSMYLVLFAVTTMALMQKMQIRSALIVDAAVSLLGVLFSGWFVIQEFLYAQITGELGLSTCVYGLIFYLIVFITSLVGLRRAA